MIWLTWRQHRAAVGIFLAIFAAAAAAYLLDGVRLHHDFTLGGLTPCVGVTNDPGCAGRRAEFLSFHGGWLQYVGPLLTFGSGALGVFLGAPLVAGEVERGTHQWAWTQRVSLARWLAVRYVVLGVVVAVLGAGLGAAYTWWNQPIAALTGPFGEFGSFDNTPLLLAAYSVFAFAVGVAASVVIRRTVPAMGATMVAFLVVRMGIMYGLRPRFEAPVTVSSAPSISGLPLGFDPRDWDWRSHWVDATGNAVPESSISHLVNPALNPAAAGLDESTVLQQHGIHYIDAVQPFQRAGTFQLVEFAIYLALIALCTGIAFGRLARRTP